ncbi:MAG: lipopolysaccharide biosynthesis protein [bacterium]|nr:lipopolysaccharide biosynthesis protein [bacterium]
MSTTRATLHHAVVYSGAAIASRLIGLLMLPLYAHVLRGHGYAVIGMLDVGLNFLISLLAYGMQGAIIRLYHDERDPARKPAVVSTGVILIASVTAALTVPLILFARPLASLLVADADLSRLVIMALVTFNLELVGQAAGAWLLLKSRSRLMSLISLLRLVLGLALNIELILRRGMGLDGYFISALVVNVVNTAVFVALAAHDCGRRYDRDIARRIRDLLLPLVPGSLASWVGRQAERVLARGLISLESVGILEMAYRFPVLIAMVVTTPFMQSWDTRRFEIADQPGAPQAISRMFTYFTFIAVWVGLVMAVVIRPVLELLTPPEFHLAYRIARVEVLTTILQGLQFHLAFGLYYAKNTALISKLRTGAAVIKVLLSWYFISRWGIYGAAFSAAVMGAVGLAADFHYSEKHYKLPLEWRTLGVITAAAVATFLWLVNWDITTTALFGWVDGSLMPRLQAALADSVLADWREGRLVHELADHSKPVTEILLKGMFAAGFGTLLPIVHPPTRTKWLAAAQRRVSRRLSA